MVGPSQLYPHGVLDATPELAYIYPTRVSIPRGTSDDRPGLHRYRHDLRTLRPRRHRGSQQGRWRRVGDRRPRHRSRHRDRRRLHGRADPRRCRRGRLHARDIAMTPLTSQAIAATRHCLTGCAIGEVLGMVLATWWGLGNAASITIAISLAFAFGYSLTIT